MYIVSHKRLMAWLTVFFLSFLTAVFTFQLVTPNLPVFSFISFLHVSLGLPLLFFPPVLVSNICFCSLFLGILINVLSRELFGLLLLVLYLLPCTVHLMVCSFPQVFSILLALYIFLSNFLSRTWIYFISFCFIM